jgi:RecJ-like exonuclease
MNCKQCNGSGKLIKDHDFSWEDCEFCRGTGSNKFLSSKKVWESLPNFPSCVSKSETKYYYKHSCSQISGLINTMTGNVQNFGRIDWNFKANFCPMCGMELPGWLSEDMKNWYGEEINRIFGE